MSYAIVEKRDWKSFFDFFSKILTGQQVEIETAGLDIGDQIEESWVQLQGISYEPQQDMLFVHAGAHDHIIDGPLEVYVSNSTPFLKTVVVRDFKNNLQIIQFKKPLMLEAPPRHHSILHDISPW